MDLEDKIESLEVTKRVLNEEYMETKKKLESAQTELDEARLWKTKAYTVERDLKLKELAHRDREEELLYKLSRANDRKHEEQMCEGDGVVLPLSGDEKKTLSIFNPAKVLGQMFRRSEAKAEEGDDAEAKAAAAEKAHGEWKKKFEAKYDQLHGQLLKEMQNSRKLRAAVMEKEFSSGQPGGKAADSTVPEGLEAKEVRDKKKNMLAG